MDKKRWQTLDIVLSSRLVMWEHWDFDKGFLFFQLVNSGFPEHVAIELCNISDSKTFSDLIREVE